MDTPASNFHPDDKTSAEAIMRSLERAHDAYKRALPENRRPVLLVSSNDETIRMDQAQWINPATIIFIRQPQSEGEALKVIVQHVSQLNALLTSEELNKAEEPRRPIGFGPAP